MADSFKFGVQDEELKKRVELYRQRKNLQYFSEAVRELLKVAVDIERAITKVR